MRGLHQSWKSHDEESRSFVDDKNAEWSRLPTCSPIPRSWIAEHFLEDMHAQKFAELPAKLLEGVMMLGAIEDSDRVTLSFVTACANLLRNGRDWASFKLDHS